MAQGKPDPGFISVDGDVRWYLSDIRLPGESWSQVLRRLLNLVPLDRATELQQFMTTEVFRTITPFTTRYLALLGFLYRQDSQRFEAAVAKVRTRGRVYFSKSPKRIEGSGVSAQPRRIEGTPLWTLTNMRYDRKIVILRHVLNSLGYRPVSQRWVVRFLNVGLAERSPRRRRADPSQSSTTRQRG